MVQGVTARSKHPHKNAKPDNEVEIRQTNQFKNNFVLRLLLGAHSKVTIQ